MSLISANFGDCAGSGVALFDGTWKDFCSAPIACAAPPDVALGIVLLGTDLRIGLARALARHRHLDAGLALEGGGHRTAPFLLDRAIDYELALRHRPRWPEGKTNAENNGAESHAAHSQELRHVPSPRSIGFIAGADGSGVPASSSTGSDLGADDQCR